MKSALYETAEEVISHEDRKQPDWNSSPCVQKIIGLSLATGNERDRKTHAGAHRAVNGISCQQGEVWGLRGQLW